MQKPMLAEHNDNKAIDVKPVGPMVKSAEYRSSTKYKFLLNEKGWL